MSAANPVTLPLKGYKARHIRLAVEGKIATITLDRPENLVTILNGRTRRLPVGGVKTLIVTPHGIRAAV